MKSCSQCHSLIPDDAGFCPECGAKQPAQQQQINPQSGAQQGPSAQQQSQQYVQMAQSFAQTGAQTAQQLSQQFFAQVGSMMRWEKMAYIGLGIAPPEPSIGILLSNGQSVLLQYPYQVIFPAVLISLLMVAFNLFANGLRDALDPTKRGEE